jgi:hypothetical protein
MKRRIKPVPAVRGGRKRLPYHSPRLSEYGSVTRLTAGGSITRSENINGSKG